MIARALLVAALLLLGCGTDDEAREYELKLKNVSPAAGVKSPKGTYKVALSPGVWLVHQPDEKMLPAGETATKAIESLAEEGQPKPWADALKGQKRDAGVFVDGETYKTAPLEPGDTRTLHISAQPSEHISLAMMYAAANDILLASKGTGIDLSSIGPDSARDVTATLALWDAGTEVNEAPGFGDYQPASKHDAGEPENGKIEQLKSSRDDKGFSYPAVGEILSVTIREREASQ